MPAETDLLFHPAFFIYNTERSTRHGRILVARDGKFLAGNRSDLFFFVKDVNARMDRDRSKGQRCDLPSRVDDLRVSSRYGMR